ncbi:MAG: formylglycine-generating enzyme family protein [Planctomycetes bacterium]|nr:formylglycine-generating enzyme family protein [Planctomycetota bacterium]
MTGISRTSSRSFIVLAALSAPPLAAQDAAKPAASPAVAEMAAYVESLGGTKVEIPMVALKVGTEGFPATVRLGSPEGEAERKADEGPQITVALEPFWIGKFEITWDTFDEFRREYRTLGSHAISHADAKPQDWADAVSLPTPLYEQDAAPILNGMGTAGGYPVANISQFAARQFTKWLSRKTGRYYRLPTEAEWEYAARAGTSTAYSFGDDPAKLGDHAWFFDNSAYEDPSKGHPDFGAGYRKVGEKAANPFGLHDMHGNVAEWVLDQYAADQYAAFADKTPSWREALRWPVTVFPCVARGGSWESEASACRSAARLASSSQWQKRDPQLPKSIWWFTDGFHVGFRIVRPLVEPAETEKLRAWESADEMTNDIVSRGGKELRAPVATPAKADGDGK